MAVWPHHLSSGTTMEPLRHLSTQSSAKRHSQYTQTYCSHTEKKRLIADFILSHSSRSCSQISTPLSLSFNSVQQCWHSKVERLFLFLPFLSPSITHSHTRTQHVTHSVIVVQKLTSWNSSSITSAVCQSGFVSLRQTWVSEVQLSLRPLPAPESGMHF